MAGIFSISREDYYDYLRCPKIVAIKIHRNFTRPPKPKSPPRRNLPYEIGTIGEEATREILSESVEIEDDDTISEPEFVPKKIQINLKAKGVHLDQTMRDILKETMDGLKTIKKYLTDEYGNINIIGHAESRSGILPGIIKPDYVAMSENLKKPILIEVKNTAKISTNPDTFQASYYNSLTQNHGVLIVGQRQEAGKNKIRPIMFENVLPETLLVYPRLGEFQIIRDSIKIDQKSIVAIWQAKQLGIQGKAPHTNCDSKCPHHRYEELPEDNIEPAIPLPLTFARGASEQNYNLDAEFYVRHYSKIGLRRELRENLGDFESWKNPFYLEQEKFPKEFTENEKILLEKKEKYLEMFSEKTELDRKTIDLLIKGRKSWDHKKIRKEMINEIHPWQKILGKKKLDKIMGFAKFSAASVYSIPEKSNDFVKKAWNEWN